MSLSLSKSVTAMAPGIQTQVLGIGGTPPYVYSVLPGGAGGAIDSVTGVYTAPATASADPKTSSDTIQVEDAVLATATGQILVALPLMLFCEILQQELGLSPGRVYLWDQKINEPNDAGLFIAISVPRCKPFSANASIDGSGAGLNSIQSVNMMAQLDIDIISRGPEARDRKEEVILALSSVYAEQQQERNSFFIGKLPAGSQFVNLSNIDGAAIPYRYKISVNMQYFVKKTQAVPYFDTFEDAQVTTDP